MENAAQYLVHQRKCFKTEFGMESVVVAFPIETLCWSPSTRKCTPGNAFHGVSGYFLSFKLLLPRRMDSHTQFSEDLSTFPGGKMLLCKKLIKVEDSPHITAAHNNTLL